MAENPDNHQHAPSDHPPGGHAIIVGFGLSGRATANALIDKGIPLYVIERNPETVRRCSIAGLRIVEGDATDEAVLRLAGIETAVLFAATMPSEHAVMEMVGIARRLNPTVKIIARCEYVSTGMKLTRRGADEVVIGEQVIAEEFSKLVEAGGVSRDGEPAAPSPPPTTSTPQPQPPRQVEVQPTGPD
ncbi:MAG TPA: NAD(P)-binding protein [Tepidisphaeraceae bacterium]|nr:NAD(P)-binding protein [Tepidisphaeraceae bacterium]